MELLIAADNIEKAACPEDVFGSDASQVSPSYRKLVLAVHPDRFQANPGHLKIATKAMENLTRLKSEAERKVRVGTYGKKHIEAPPAKVAFTPISIEARGKKYQLIDILASGDLCDIYLCDVEGERKVFKVARDGKDNDLVENEFKILNMLYPPSAKEEKFYRFLPKISDSFIIRSPGSQKRANIMPWFDEFYSLAEVMSVYPDGIDFRDMVWMFKRILHGIGFAHEKGVSHEHPIIHGALVPSHVLIHPVNHGAKLIDWSYAVQLNTLKKPLKPSYYYSRAPVETTLHIKAVCADYKDYYPPEVFKKKEPSPATDIYMAAKCAIALVGGNIRTNEMPKSIPSRVQHVFKLCVQEDQSRRPNHAWDLHEHLDEVLREEVGKRKYRPFPMPKLRETL